AIRGAGDGVFRDLPRGAAREDRGVGAADRVLAGQGVGDVVAEADAVLGAGAHTVAGDLRSRGEAIDDGAAGVAGDGVVVQRRAGAAADLDPVVAVGRDGAAGDGVPAEHPRGEAGGAGPVCEGRAVQGDAVAAVAVG